MTTIESIVKKLLIKEPFYGLFLLNLKRGFGNKCDTACVYRDGINTALSINQEFWDNLDSDDMRMSVIKHELNHILYHHITMQKCFSNHERFNYAADCECNSSIPLLQAEPYIFASRFGLEDHKGTKYYYENLPKLGNDDEDNQPSNNSGSKQSGEEGSSSDNSKYGPNNSHKSWKDFDDLSETEKKLIDNQIDYQMKNTAEQVQKMCGSIPGKIQEYLNGLKPKPQVFNWKAYFKRVIGNLITSELYLTKMRPSRRFPDSRGVKFKRKPHVLVGIDTSGSISTSELNDFISEIHHIWKSGVKVTIAQIDTRIQHIEEYNGTFTQEIYGRGGRYVPQYIVICI